MYNLGGYWVGEVVGTFNSHIKLVVVRGSRYQGFFGGVGEEVSGV